MAISEEDRYHQYRVPSLTPGRQIQISIPVEVTRNHGTCNSIACDRECPCRSKRTVSVALQGCHGTPVILN